MIFSLIDFSFDTLFQAIFWRFLTSLLEWCLLVKVYISHEQVVRTFLSVLFLLVAVDEVSGNVFLRFQGKMVLTVPAPSDDMFRVRCLTAASFYFFNNILIVAHGVFFILFFARRRYAWFCTIRQLVRLT